MEKLTLKELALFYGCEIQWKYYSWTSFEKTILDSRFIGKYLPNETIEIKPILRPLLTITDLEFKEVVLLNWLSDFITSQMFGNIERKKEYKQEVKYGTSVPYSIFDKNEKHIVSGTFSSNSLNPKQLQYLTLNSFDIFGWIDKDLAVKK